MIVHSMHRQLAFKPTCICYIQVMTRFESDVIGFESDVTCFEDDATRFEDDVIGFEDDVTRFEDDATRFESDVIMPYTGYDWRPHRRMAA